jgi:CspA family cold shock protein
LIVKEVKEPHEYLTSHEMNNKLIFFKMKTGKVKFFNETKGFGFIKEDESEKEYFVHASGLIDKIKEDDDVTFELVEGRKGLNAVDVKLV